MPDRPTPSQPRKLHQWESAVDKQIREAQERGDFDALPGRGKPLPRDSWGGGEWALAYHVLKQAGETLPWIALGREIEVAEERLRKLAESARSMRPADRVGARERYLREAAALDKMLLEYSFLIPSRRLEKGRLPPHIAARQWDSALGA